MQELQNGIVQNKLVHAWRHHHRRDVRKFTRRQRDNEQGHQRQPGHSQKDRTTVLLTYIAHNIKYRNIIPYTHQKANMLF